MPVHLPYHDSSIPRRGDQITSGLFATMCILAMDVGVRTQVGWDDRGTMRRPRRRGHLWSNGTSTGHTGHLSRRMARDNGVHSHPSTYSRPCG